MSFAEAATAFEDPLSLTVADDVHSRLEQRWRLLDQTKAAACSSLRTRMKPTRFASSAPAEPRAWNAMPSNKRAQRSTPAVDAMPSEIDIRGGVRGTYPRLGVFGSWFQQASDFLPAKPQVRLRTARDRARTSVQAWGTDDTGLPDSGGMIQAHA